MLRATACFAVPRTDGKSSICANLRWCQWALPESDLYGIRLGKTLAGRMHHLARSSAVAHGVRSPPAHEFVRHWRIACSTANGRSVEHTSELQSLMRISYAV